MKSKILSKLLSVSGLCLLLASECLPAAPFPDLTEKTQDFVLEEKQIIIPGYPDAFNPSIVRWKDGELLLCFRARDPLTGLTNLIGFVTLNEDYEPIGKPSLLKIIGGRDLSISRAQDPRLIRVGEKYYIVYNNILNDDDLETRRMLVAPLHEFMNHFFIIDPQYLLDFVGDAKNWIEKNWAPFDYFGELMLSYSLNPHRILKPTLKNESCYSVALTEAEVKWPWGGLRGGTPSIRDGKEYFGIFHSCIDMKTVQSNGKKISHYFMGAYRFKAEPPFEMTYISPEPIYGREFYTSPEYPTWKPLRVVFPGGLIMDKDFVWVVYGRQDYECWVVKLDKKGLMKSLVPLKKIKTDH